MEPLLSVKPWNFAIFSYFLRTTICCWCCCTFVRKTSYSTATWTTSTTICCKCCCCYTFVRKTSYSTTTCQQHGQHQVKLQYVVDVVHVVAILLSEKHHIQQQLVNNIDNIKLNYNMVLMLSMLLLYFCQKNLIFNNNLSTTWTTSS